MVSFACHIVVAVLPLNGAPVEAVQPVLGAKPHKAVAILDDGFHVALRQAILAINMREIVIGRLLPP